MVPGTAGANVLVACGPLSTIQELDDATGGTTTDPLWQLAVNGTDTCKTLPDPGKPLSWYRAYPLVTLGEF